MFVCVFKMGKNKLTKDTFGDILYTRKIRKKIILFKCEVNEHEEDSLCPRDRCNAPRFFLWNCFTGTFILTKYV